MPSNWKHSNCS